jgi:hypothetical protein
MSNPPKTFAARATGNIQVWVDDGAHRLTDQGEFEELPTEQHTSRVQIVVKSSGAISEKGEAVNYQYFEGVDPNSPFVENYVEELAAAVQETEGKEKSKYRPVFLTANAITLSDKVQLVLRFYGDPEGIHENYDFVHACNFWTSWERKVTLKAEALESLMAKELRYIGSKYPVCSIFRVRKFLNRGFSITAGQLFKICHQISELNLSDFDVLREQLTGVDTAYFEEVIKKVKAKGLDSNTVDSSYLMQLIDGLL